MDRVILDFLAHVAVKALPERLDDDPGVLHDRFEVLHEFLAPLEGFVQSAAIELRRDRRINLVSPTMLEESSPLYGPYFVGTRGVATNDVVLGYVKSVEGGQTGCVYRIGWSRDR